MTCGAKMTLTAVEPRDFRIVYTYRCPSAHLQQLGITSPDIVGMPRNHPMPQELETYEANRMPLMSTLGFGPEMVDFRTVMAAAFLLGVVLVILLAAQIWVSARCASDAKVLLVPTESPNVADDATTRDVALASIATAAQRNSEKAK
jgi:hypothetical protein